jgi:hypothetical protein
MGTHHWEDYCEKYKDSDGKYILRCTWGSSTPGGEVCGYTSKKQLVKRHIETTHLKLKYAVTGIPDTDANFSVNYIGLTSARSVVEASRKEHRLIRIFTAS